MPAVVLKMNPTPDIFFGFGMQALYISKVF
jgi:hypothetical protein